MRRTVLHAALFLLCTGMVSLTPLLGQQPQPSAAPDQPKAPAKLYELRIYTANPGKLPDLHARFRDHTMKLFEKHGIENLYYWTVSKGTNAETAVAADMLVYLIAHKDKAAADASWAAFAADPDWQAALAKSEENGKILAKDPVAVFMSPTQYSPPDQPVNKSSNAPPRLFELRKYNGESQFEGHVHRFQSGEEAIFRKVGMETLNFWTANDKSAFIYLLAHKDQASSDEEWKKFFVDFRAFQTEYNTQVAEGKRPNARANPAGGQQAAGGGQGRRGGGGGGGNEVRFLVPTDYSPRK